MITDILSIRLSADGLYFWTGDKADGYDSADMTIARAGEGQRVSTGYSLNEPGREVAGVIREAVSETRGIFAARGIAMPTEVVLYADTAETVLVPSELFREEEIDRYLSLHGFITGGDRYSVCSKPLHGTVAVLVLHHTHTRALGAELGSFMVASPLQYNLCLEAGQGAAENKIRVYTGPHRCYVTVFSGGSPAFSEVLPLGSAADLVYYLSWLSGKFDSAAWPVAIAGDRAAETAEALTGRFNVGVCG